MATVSSDSQHRKGSNVSVTPYIPLEEIDIKPSAELIPDIFDRPHNKNFIVKVLYKQAHDYAKQLIDTLKYHGFTVSNKVIQGANDKIVQQQCIKEMDQTQSEISESCDGIIIVLLKIPLNGSTMKEIWSTFTWEKCPALKNKPKIFLFQNIQMVQAESGDGRSMSYPDPYDTPREGDMLIIYDNYIPGGYDFISSLNENINDYGKQEDLLTLVTVSEGSARRPVVITTFTRKFYLTNSEVKGTHYEIMDYQKKTKEHLSKIDQHIQQIKTRVESPRYRSTIKRDKPSNDSTPKTKTSASTTKPLSRSQTYKEKPAWRY